ncbi:MAG: RidA family protein [Betaproteobacteria bacterium]|nr:RidA family protein [Betaproteobacteria bacterium]
MGVMEDKLARMGLRLPPVHPYPSPNRIPCVQVGNILFLGGHSTARHPLMLGAKNTGKVGTEITEQEAYVAARAVALQILASIKARVGDLDRLKRVIRLHGMVNSAPGFERQFAVIDGASDLFFELWGPERGAHARSAVGVAELPRRSILEIVGEFEIYAERRTIRRASDK